MRIMQKFYRYIALPFAMSVIAACGGGGGGDSLPQSISLSAVASTPSEVQLSWAGGPSGVMGYDVYRNGVSVFPTHLSGTAVTDTGLAAGTRYCYRVYAVSFPMGTVAQSNEACVGTPAYASNWTRANVAVGSAHDFALAGSGARHASYRRAGGLYYAYSSGGAWTEDLVDTGVGTFGRTSIALDATGVPHIAYGNTSTGGLYYANKTGGTWAVEPVNATGGSVAALTLDGSGKAHVLYSETSVGHSVWYATNASGTWVKTFLSGQSNTIQSAAVALDSGGAMHVAYAVGDGACTIMYMNYAGGSATESLVEEAAGCMASLTLRGHLVPYIGYRKAQQMMYALPDGGGWSKNVISTLSWLGGDYVSLAFSSGNVMHFSFKDQNADLAYGFVTDSTTRIFLDKVVSHSVLKMGSDGRAYILYDADSAGTLRLAISP